MERDPKTPDHPAEVDGNTEYRYVGALPKVCTVFVSGAESARNGSEAQN
jgi:hypothetical protein